MILQWVDLFYVIVSYLHQCDNLRIEILFVNVRTLKCINHLLKRTHRAKHQIPIIYLYFRELTSKYRKTLIYLSLKNCAKIVIF